MSFVEPDLSLYPHLHTSFAFTPTNELRASFLAYDTAAGEFPWTVSLDYPSDIVPVKISFGCAQLAEHIEFYTNVLEADLLLHQRDVISSLDGHTVSYAFLRPKNDRFEIAYYERPVGYTYGSLTTELYKHLVRGTHTDVVSSPVCGLDRWFDNHYGFDTLKWADDAEDYNYMDRVLARIVERGYAWRLYHTPYEDESPEGKMWMEEYGFMDLYTLYVFDLNGQVLSKYSVQSFQLLVS